MLDDEGTLSEKHLRLLRGLGEHDWGAGGQNLFSGFPIGDMLDFCKVYPLSSTACYVTAWNHQQTRL
jgi:hypothetical protein